MPLKYLILLIIAVCTIGWGVFILLRNPKHPINILFAITMCGAGAWAALLAVIDPLVSSPEMAEYLYGLVFICGMFIAIVFYFFSYFFPYPRKFLTGVTVLYSILNFAMISFLFFSGSVFTMAHRSGDFWVYKYDTPLYIIYSLYLCFYFGFAFYNLMTTAPRGESLPPRVFPVVVGTLVAVAGGIIFSLVIPAFSNREYEWMAPYFLPFMVGYISYFIFIKR